MQGFTSITDMIESVRASKADSSAVLPLDIRAEIDWTDFSSVHNPLGTPKQITDAISEAITKDSLSFLPNRTGSALITQLAQIYDLPEECFMVGTSAFSAISAVASAYRPCNVGIPVPAPAEYFLRVANVGHNPVKLTNPFSLAAIEPERAKNNGVRFEAAILANPSYPCARLLSEATLKKYLDCCNWVIVDESNIHLTMGGMSFLSLTQKYKNLIVVQSLSIDVGMPGVPISFTVAHPDTMNFLRQFSDGSTIGLFHEVIAPVLPELREYVSETEQLLDSEIPWLQCMLSLTPGVKIYPSEANFVMCSLEERAVRELGIPSAADLIVRLQKNGFTVRDLEGTPGIEGNKFFLVSVRTHEENERFVSMLRKIIQDDSKEENIQKG
ncbi:MAG: aminotransferase class I/II-fold pyridoxal phosphate-dependent enzyme [Anaerotardibacter sp.]